MNVELELGVRVVIAFLTSLSLGLEYFSVMLDPLNWKSVIACDWMKVNFTERYNNYKCTMILCLCRSLAIDLYNKYYDFKNQLNGMVSWDYLELKY